MDKISEKKLNEKTIENNSSLKQEVKAFETRYNIRNVTKTDFYKANENMFGKMSNVVGAPTKTWLEIIKRFFSNPYVAIALIIFLGVVALAIFAPIFSPYNTKDPIANSSKQIISLLPPRTLHGGEVTRGIVSGNDTLVQLLKQENIPYQIDTANPIAMSVTFDPWPFLDKQVSFHQTGFIGTDANGFDIWTRLWVGTRNSIGLALLVAISETVIGVIIGAYIGFHAGGKIDLFLMRVIDVVSSVPSLIWFILLLFVLPAGFWSMFIALTAVGWMGPVYSTRMFMLRTKDAEYIKAAEAIGVSKFRIIFEHALPNIIGKLMVSFVHRIPAVIFAEASLAFLGLSPDPLAATLGNIINDAKGHIDLWWYILSPTLVILTITLTLQLIANGLHDAFDPRTARVK